MLADSVYYFERTSGLTTSYILQSRQGAELPNFPATYQRTPKNKLGSYPALKGKQYVNFREMCNTLNPLQTEKFEYCLALAPASYPVGLNFPNNTRRAAGNNRCMPGRNDAYLVEFSQDWNKMALFIFEKRGNDCDKLLKQWNEGEGIEIKATA